MLNIKNFHEIQASTRTIIVMTNISFDIQKLYDHLPIMEYNLPEKKRGRRKKNIVQQPENNLKAGDIITIEYKNNIRGTRLKKKRKSVHKKNDSYFRNSITIVMVVNTEKDTKYLNFKITNNGKFQITGCKTEEQAEFCVSKIWELIKDNEWYVFLDDSECLKATFIPVMRNIDFSLGFNIDREKLSNFIQNNTEYTSLLESDIGYTGVNIKIPFTASLENYELKVLSLSKNGQSKQSHIKFQEYMKTLSDKEREKKLNKKRFHTFLVFQSGNIIMSSLCTEFAEKPYYDFMKLIQNNIEQVKEKLGE